MAFADRKLAFSLAALVSLTACGGGGGDDDRSLTPNDEPPIKQEDEGDKPIPRLFSNGDLSIEPSLSPNVPVGIYQYTDTSANGGNEAIGLAIISQSGRMALAMEDSMEFARIQINDDNRFEQRLESTYTGQNEIARIIRGRRDTGVSPEALARISGTILEEASGNLILNYRLDRQQPDDLSLTSSSAAGTYSGIGEDGTGTVISLAADGTLVGSDTSGCDFSGEYTIPDPAKDVFEASFLAEKCGPAVGIPAGDRDGHYFAVGRLSQDSGSLTMFGTNGEIGVRVTATNTDPGEDEPEESATFFMDDFDISSSVVTSLEAGTYSFNEIPIEASQSDLESGILVISDTGRMSLATDRRLAVARIEVSDVDTFRTTLTQSERAGASQQPSNAVEIFGTPDNGATGTFKLAGSLLGSDQELLNRFSAERIETNDDVFTATPLDLPTVSGTYSGTRNPGAITATITIAVDGTLTGSDTTGCVYNGVTNITSPDAGIYEIRTTVANCSASTTASGSERNGTYNGIADFTPGTPDTIRLTLGSETNVEHLELERQ